MGALAAPYPSSMWRRKSNQDDHEEEKKTLDFGVHRDPKVGVHRQRCLLAQLGGSARLQQWQAKGLTLCRAAIALA